jgi:hypothetical protein
MQVVKEKLIQLKKAGTTEEIASLFESIPSLVKSEVEINLLDWFVNQILGSWGSLYHI